MRNASENILLELIDQILYQPCFDQLRNKEYLGYLVRMSIRKSNGTHGLQIIVQGNSSPSHLQSRIEEFLKSSQQVAFFARDLPYQRVPYRCSVLLQIAIQALLGTMAPDEFEKHKDSLRLRKSDPPKKLERRGNRIWNEEVYTRTYNFDRLQEELRVLDEVRLEDLRIFYEVRKW
jgi:insulysin